MRAWIDIDNPPQVQYLAPFIEAFERRGLEVFVTARDYGMTTELLGQRTIGHLIVGTDLGTSRVRKVSGTIARALRLTRAVPDLARPSLLLSTSRSGVIAAWLMGIPSFMVLDYEHVELGSFRAAGTTVLHPDVIDSAVFRAKGFPPERLIPFAGLKEDLTFVGFDVDAVEAHDFGVRGDDVTLVLVRPPSETSHYFEAATRDLTHGVLARLASDPTLRVVFSPRHPAQVDEIALHRWCNEPIVLDRAVEFVSLLKGVDWVVCAGGTMLREAAYLGVPAISIFRGEIGAVDRSLEAAGAIRIATRPEDLDRISWRDTGREQRVAHHPRVIEELVQRMLSVIESTPEASWRRRLSRANPAPPGAETPLRRPGA